jgi:hypothetical protein
MANSTLALGSSLNLRRINKSASSLSESVRRAQTSSASISKSLLESNRDKRKSLSLASTLFRRRREATLRREKEDIIEAGSIVGAVKRTGKVVMNSTKGFLGRILDYLGTVLIGWAVLNLPKIIKLAEDLTQRMQKYFGILQDFVGGVSNFFIGLPDKFGEIFNSISTFSFGNTKEFFDNTLDKLQTSFQRLQNSVSQFIRRFTSIDTPEKLMEYFDLDMKMFDIPGLDKFKEMLGVETEETETETSTTTSTPSGPAGPMGTAYGVDVAKLATATGAAEGAYSSIGQYVNLGGREKGYGLGRYQFMTYRSDVRGEVLVRGKSQGISESQIRDLFRDTERGGAAGRRAAEKMRDILGQSGQDKIFKNHVTNTLTQIKRKYPNATEDFLVQKFGVYHLSGGDYPNSADQLGTTAKSHGDKILRVYKSLRGSSSQSQSQESPAAQKVSFNSATRPNAARATTLLASAPEMPTNLLVLNTTKTKIVERKSPPPQQGSFNMPVAMVNNTHEKMQFTALA